MNAGKTSLRVSGVFILSLVLSSCGDLPPPIGIPPGGTTFIIDFSLSPAGWSGEFADYPVGEEPFYELDSGFRFLPAPLDTSKLAFMLAGNNHSDDLFMFLKGQINGLTPNADYLTHFQAAIATDAPTGCAGVGGPPGEGVWVKAGLTVAEPGRFVDGLSFYRMTVDKGNQSTGGSDAVVLGNIANSNTDCSNFVYELKELSGGFPAFTVRTDGTGSLWWMVGTDSGFEATTTLYYTRIAVTVWEL